MNPFTIITAHDLNLGIGNTNSLPWIHKADMRWFKEKTIGVAVIMGRNTWESLPEQYRPLPDRLNIVISSKDLNLPSGVILVRSLDEALKVKAEEHMVIGGAILYKDAIKHEKCYGIFITKLENKYNCDTFFPKYTDLYKREIVFHEGIENDVKYSISFWEKKD